MPERDITLSIVSHGQNALTNQFLEDVERHCAGRAVLLITQNSGDAVPIATNGLSFPAELIVNTRVKGFGANHNAAFTRCHTPYFCVSNPDIRLSMDPFPALLEALAHPQAGVAGPLVRDTSGKVEDSARRFPMIGHLVRKLLREPSGPDYPIDRGALEVDWVAGMFMLFSAAAFHAVGGFDEAYFLYYEDVDICRRLMRAGKRTMFVPRAEVTHDARRASRKDMRYARHHAASLLRYLISR